MPRLLVFVACERTLIDTDGNVSLLVLLQQVTVGRRPDATTSAPIPKNAVGPKDWSIFCLWKPEQGDFGGELFVQKLQVLWPDKKEFKTHSFDVQFTEGKGHNVVLNITGFPLGQAGAVMINMWLERAGQRIGEVHSWTVEVKHELRT